MIQRLIRIVFYLNDILKRIFAAISKVVDVIIRNSHKFKIVWNNDVTGCQVFVRGSATAE
jgi:hypothetical protein